MGFSSEYHHNVVITCVLKDFRLWFTVSLDLQGISQQDLVLVFGDIRKCAFGDPR
jgi:hypothetical protein